MNRANEQTVSVADAAQIPELPGDIQELILEVAKIDIRTRLKSRLWKGVHNELIKERNSSRWLTTFPIELGALGGARLTVGRFYLCMNEPLRTAFTEAGSGIGTLRSMIEDTH